MRPPSDTSRDRRALLEGAGSWHPNFDLPPWGMSLELVTW